MLNLVSLGRGRSWSLNEAGRDEHQLRSPSVGKHSGAQEIRVSYFTIGNMFHLSLGKHCEKNAFDSG